MSKLERERLHWKHKLVPELVRLAWPISVSMLSHSVMSLADTLFVGWLGASALAAVGLGGVATFTLFCFGWGLMRAVKVLVSQCSGAGEHGLVPAYIGAGVGLALAVGALMAAGGWLLSIPLPAVASDEQAGELGAAYFRVRVLGAPLFLLAGALSEARQGLGDSRSPMLAEVVANGVNVALDPLFVFVLGLGVPGAAWATLCAYVVSAGLMLRVQLRRGPAPSMPGRAALRDVLRMGLPLGVQFVLEVGSFAVLVAILARVSAVDLAAHQVALQLVHFSFLPALALGEAASVLIGQAVGAGEDNLVRRVAGRALWLAAAYTGACAVAFVAAAEAFARCFSEDPAVVALTVRLLYVAAAFQVFDGANIIARCALRGAGDVRYAAVVSVVVAWVCTPPLTWWLGVELGYGAVGGWLGIFVEIVVGVGLLWHRLERGRWQSAARRSREALTSRRREAASASPQPAAAG